MSAAPSSDPAARGAAGTGAGTGAGAARAAAANGAAHARVPDFYIVGQPKAGTTALHDMLSRHPSIYMPERKEPWFFAEELLERTPPRPGGTPSTMAEYTALFAAAGADQLIGEASPMYLWSQTAAARIAEVQPEAKIVVILREPASFLRSLHRQFIEIYVETENDFRRAIELEADRRAGRNLPRRTYWPKAIFYSDHVRYVEQLRRYHDLFGRDRVLVLLYDDFRRDNEATVREVLRFVGVDDSHPVQVLEANPTVHVRSQRMNALVHALQVGRGPVSRAAKAAIKALTPQGLRRTALRHTKNRIVYGAPRPDDDAFMSELRARFRPEVEALSSYLGRDLVATWGYDADQ